MRLSALGLLLRGALVAVALGIWALAGADLSAEAVVALRAGASAALTLGLAPSVWRLALWPTAIDRAAIRRMLVFSIPMVAFAASQYGMRAVDIVVLGAFEGHDVVGVYAAAFQAFVMLSQLTTTLTIVLVPLFVSMQHAGRAEDLRDYLSRRLPQLTLGWGSWWPSRRPSWRSSSRWCWVRRTRAQPTRWSCSWERSSFRASRAWRRPY